jgi:hypothetical protein
MIGGGFQHDVCSSGLNTNKYIEWKKDFSADVSFYIDDGLLLHTDKTKKNYGWLLESSTIISELIQFVIKNLDYYKANYECIFTHDKRICKLDPFFKFCITNACTYIQNKKIYEKNKDISFIVSNNKGKPGYEFRLAYLEKVKDKVDHFGRGFKTELPFSFKDENGNLESGKLLGLKDYRFSFAFENDCYSSIFCEKLTDCFATGTIPIFQGAPDIGDFFDINGIIIFNENIDLSELNIDLYKSKRKSIENNFNLTLNLQTAEDYIYLNYLK